jgi:hypothetical protein
MPEISIKDALNKAFVKVRPERAAIDKFKANIVKLLDEVTKHSTDREETIKTLFSNFLKNTWYDPDYFIIPKDDIDLVIHNGDSSTPIGILIEAKRPSNKNEMVSRSNLNAKAMQELLLYYLRETIDNKNFNIKHLIITNAIEWFIFDGSQFYKHFSLNHNLIKDFQSYSSKSLLFNDTNSFYTNIASPCINKVKNDIEYAYFNINEYEGIIKKGDNEQDNKLIDLYKILSPNHLLKKSFVNDSNTLNQNFYQELLYILGLTEKIEEGKVKIGRYEDGKQQDASLIEETISQLNIKKPTFDDDTLYDISFELNITWVNRILFLKLLEAQQLKYQNGNLDYAFLNTRKIDSFNKLNTLFFNVLAVSHQNRADKVKKDFINVPYLNSSLFEITENENDYLLVSNLDHCCPV